MISEAQLRSIAIFYFYSLQDEKLATQASAKTIAQLKLRQKEENLSNQELSPALVSATLKNWKILKKNIRSTQSAVSEEAGWIVPAGTDLGAWRQFRKEANEEEFLAVIWSLILGMKDETISKGLGVTVGTVRHRVGKGLKLLGTMVNTDVRAARG
ncbi:MAG: hypothetical protein KDD34_01105 [Bdellovibrionales bacterium]|nr:hypothetical protein [Bdellovibrionales bacterium]